MMRVLVLLTGAFLLACGPGIKGGPTMNNSVAAPDPSTAPTSDVISADILEREPLANMAKVQHILIGWKDLEGAHDERAEQRTKQQAEQQVRDLLAQLKAGASFEDLMKQYSEDPGSASTGRAYDVSPDAQLVIEFKQLGLRLHVGEIGVVASDYGFHIIKRVE